MTTVQVQSLLHSSIVKSLKIDVFAGLDCVKMMKPCDCD